MGTEKAVDVKSCIGMKWQNSMIDNWEFISYFILKFLNTDLCFLNSE